jgi:hemoglobin
LRQPAPGVRAGINEATIERVVHAFYDRIRGDAFLGPIFASRIEDARWPTHLATMVEFWSSVLLMTGTYKGRPVPAHMPMRLEDQHFRHWLSLFKSVVEEQCAPQAAELFMDRAHRIADSLRMAASFGPRGAAPVLVEPLSPNDRP